MAICSLSLNKFPSLFPNLPSLSRHFPSSPYKNQLSISYKPLASYRFPPGRRSIEEEEEEDNDSVNGSNSKFTEANHKGAMMEIGEGLCKLRKLNFDTGPFHQFERDMSAVLDFIYQTQLEFAACNDDMCIAMDQSETSYKLLGGYGAGQHLYWLEMDGSASLYIVFCPDRSVTGDHQPRVRLPILYASQEHLMELEQS
ncbi:putative TTHA0068-like superfamily protein [Helianthus annuus]|nr:putative TTHA0068-like superfamily protein [Helianthus annuus]